MIAELQDLVSEIEQRYRESSYYALRELTCERAGGAVVVRGTVPTYYLKQLAQEAIKDTIRGKTFVNAIQVNYGDWSE